MLESTRKKEEEVKKETSEQLDLFRRQQEEKDKELLEGGEELDGKARSPTAGESQSPWAVNARKRKRAKENEKAGLKGLKLRKSSSTSEAPVELSKSSLTSKAPDVSKTEVDKDSAEELRTTASKIPSTTEKTTAKVSPSRPPERVATQNRPEQDKSSGLKASGSPGLGLAGYSSDDED